MPRVERRPRPAAEAQPVESDPESPSPRRGEGGSPTRLPGPIHPLNTILRVPESLTCISCGYSLAGLARDANCPECNCPVSKSRDAHLLFSDAVFDPFLTARRLAILAAAQVVATLALAAPLVVRWPVAPATIVLWFGLLSVSLFAIRLCWVLLTDTVGTGKTLESSESLRFTSFMRLAFASLLILSAAVWAASPTVGAIVSMIVGFAYLLLSGLGCMQEWSWLTELSELLRARPERVVRVLAVAGITLPAAGIAIGMLTTNAVWFLGLYSLAHAAAAIAGFVIAHQLRAGVLPS